jgi:hypothetical protein
VEYISEELLDPYHRSNLVIASSEDRTEISSFHHPASFFRLK